MTTQNSDDDGRLATPEPPEPSGYTTHMHATLVQRRKERGLTQEELGQMVFEYGEKQAKIFNEKPRWKQPLSKAAISQWESMFPLDGREPTEPLKQRRQSFSLNDYAVWGRVLGLRMRTVWLEADDSRELLIVQPDTAKMLRRINSLPEDKQAMIRSMIESVYEGERRE